MFPDIRIFVSNPSTAEDGQIIKFVKSKGFEPFVDSLNKNNYSWLHANYSNTPHKFFLVGVDNLEIFSIEDLDLEMIVSPSFAISYNSNDLITDHDWRLVHRFFAHTFFPLLPKPKIISRRAHDLLAITYKQEKEPQIEEMQVDEQVNDAYDFRMEIIEDRNICLCEVIKPFTDNPYTVVIRDFKERNLKPFFTSLFICPSWGVSRFDIEFLRHLWVQLGMQGECDLEQMLKEAVEACTPSDKNVPVGEPEVYRKSIEQTRQILQAKEEGHLFKSTY